MPYELMDLVVNRVDLVDEGANSAAFIELYKRKEKPMNIEEIISKMKPEHAKVVQDMIEAKDAEITKANDALAAKAEELTAATDALAKANEEIETLKSAECECECDGEADDKCMCKVCGKPKKKRACDKSGASFDETETLKAMPEHIREAFITMRKQKEAAEEMVRKNAEEKLEAAAVAKAASLKALPIEQGKLVGIVKGCSDEVYDLLKAANQAIEDSLLTEVGKNAGNGATTTSKDAWGKLEDKATEIAKRDGVTVEKAMSAAISENPELYREYLQEV